MAGDNRVAGAFRLLQGGDAQAALREAQALLESDASVGRAHLLAGMALRALGRMDEARPAFERAAALDRNDFAAAYELGLIRGVQGNADGALAELERASRLRPAFAPAAYAAGIERFRRRDWREAAAHFQVALTADPRNVDAALAGAQALQHLGRPGEAEALFLKALEGKPGHAAALRTYGQFLVARGRFAEAAERFSACARLQPQDADVAMYLAQSTLLAGRLQDGWRAYGARETRQRHVALRASVGHDYATPEAGTLREGRLRIVAEQGLGDILFFLRYAPALSRSGLQLQFSGDARLHAMLRRTNLFETIDQDGARRAVPEVLSGDLPLFAPESHPPPLPLTADPLRIERWRAAMEALGPRPWTGVTWRAGTPGDVLAHGLEKQVPIEALFVELRRLGGTVFALQRKPAAGELDAAARALGTVVQDFSGVNDDLEDALAVLSLLDRHVGVSNTNMHLAAGLGRTADVLVPFPPEWRWGAEGETSAWYPGFRVLRQATNRDWGQALRAL